LDRIKAPRAAGILRHCFILPLVKVKLTDHASGFACPANLPKGAVTEADPDPNESMFIPRCPLRARKLARFIRKTKPFLRKEKIS